MFIRDSKKRTGLAVAVGLFLTIGIQGCSGLVLKQVSESGKDQSGQYDGKWQASVKSTAASQSAGGGWQLTCSDMAGKNLGVLSVVDGVATLGQERSAMAYVSPEGKFRFEVPTGEVAAAGGTSDASIDNGDMTIILYGSLQKQIGVLTYGIAEFSNNGCSSKVMYEKV